MFIIMILYKSMIVELLYHKFNFNFKVYLFICESQQLKQNIGLLALMFSNLSILYVANCAMVNINLQQYV